MMIAMGARIVGRVGGRPSLVQRRFRRQQACTAERPAGELSLSLIRLSVLL
jgi:hypothetical protein